MAGGDPLLLPRMTVLLPTRRAVRSLREAFLRVAPDGKAIGTPWLLPRMRPVGDAGSDELLLSDGGAEDLAVPPPIPELRRRLLLTRLVLRWGERRGDEPLYPDKPRRSRRASPGFSTGSRPRGRASRRSPIWFRRDWRSTGASSTIFSRSCRSIGPEFSPRRGRSTPRPGAIACWNAKPRLGAALHRAIR